MKPIGVYPSPAEYKSVGLIPPPRHVLKQALLASNAEVDEDDLMTDSPITPVGDENATPIAIRTEDDEEGLDLTGPVVASQGSTRRAGVKCRGRRSEVRASPRVNGEMTSASEVNEDMNDYLNGDLPVCLMNGVSGDYKNHDQTLDSFMDTTPATPISNSVDHLAQPSFSSTGDILTPLRQTQTPPVTAVVDGMPPAPGKAAGPDFFAVLKALPTPTSKIYDVRQLKSVVESAIQVSSTRGEHDVALSLVHYWSDTDGDDFKLSLLHNLGREKADHRLELALRTMLRGSLAEANEWLKINFPDHPDSGSESGLSSAKSLEPEPSSRAPFKAADIYRDTSGPKLEEAFLTGKTNTAPLKRPKKPCPVNELPFKRRQEWDADPTLEETLRNKRVRLSQGIREGISETQESSVRSGRDESNEMDLPTSPGSAISSGVFSPPIKKRTLEEREQDRQKWEAKCKAEAEAKKRGKGGRGRGRGRGKGRGKTRRGSKSKSRSRSRSRSGSPKPKPKPKPNIKPLTDLEKAMEKWYKCMSDRENDWEAAYERRLTPSAIDPPDNVDECTECDGGGELLCCDTCDNALHLDCVKPRMKKPPKGEDDWYCSPCDLQLTLTYSIRRGEFGTGKTEFTPPKDVKNHFWGVGQVFDRGSFIYQEVPHIPRVTKPQRLAPSTLEANMLKLGDNGQIFTCVKCGKTTEHVKHMIRCDYCPSRWHLDCLDPPLAKYPNSATPLGWMCPNHVRPSDMVVTKMVDGRLQERRVRRPKGTIADVDIDVLDTEDQSETSFDDEWREKRLGLPAGDIVLNFISAVHNDPRRREIEHFNNIQENTLNYARQFIADHYSSGGTNSPTSQGLPPLLEQNITTAIQNMKTGKVPGEQYDAAASLITLSKGPQASSSTAVADDESTTDPSASKPDEPAATDDASKQT